MSERLHTQTGVKDTQLRQPPLPVAINQRPTEEPSPEELQEIENALNSKPPRDNAPPGDPLTRYFKELMQIPLLTAEEERECGMKIFLAKLALSNLVALKTLPLIPPQQKSRVENVLTDKRAIRLLDALNDEMKQKPRKIRKNEPEDDAVRKDVSSEIQFIQDVAANDKVTEEKIRDFRTTEDAEAENQALTEFIQQQVKFAESGFEAANLLITSNLRLAFAWAKKEHEKIRRPLDIQDFDSFAREGLIIAVDRFDYRKRNKFSTFAVWWIRQTIIRGIMDSSSTIRVPVNTLEVLLSMFGLQRKIMQDTGEEIPIEQIITTHAVGEREEENLLSALKAQRSIISLDKPLDEENEKGSAKFGSLIADSVNVEETAITTLTQEGVRQALGKLPERERKILFSRFGIDDGKPKSLEEVGEEFGITRERVRQIQEAAYRKLLKDEKLTSIANSTFGKEDK